MVKRNRAQYEGGSGGMNGGGGEEVMSVAVPRFGDAPMMTTTDSLNGTSNGNSNETSRGRTGQDNEAQTESSRPTRRKKKNKKAPAPSVYLDPDLEAPPAEPSSLSSRASDPRLSPPPSGVYAASNAETLPANLEKYYAQRYRLFSNFDNNIWLTYNAWFEVTPECISNFLAEKVLGISYEDAQMMDAAGDLEEPEMDSQGQGSLEEVESTSPKRRGKRRKQIIVDAFCGVGGNTLAFAAHAACAHVVAIDSDPLALKCLVHNARVFNLSHKITILQADFFELAHRPHELPSPPTGFAAGPFDAVFVSPPWGGPSYQTATDQNGGIFDLEKMEPYPFSAVFDAAKQLSERMAFFLPRTSDMRQIAAKSVGLRNGKVSAVHCCVKRASKAICALYGDFE